MNEKKIALISVVLTLLFVIIVFNCISIYSPSKKGNSELNYYSPSEFKLSFYGDISDAYQTDEEVIKVYELCLDSEIKAICVYENIEFVWSKSFEIVREDYFFSPTELIEYGGYGTCRDIAVFRMAVFKKLNIYAEFVFIRGHVYVKVIEDGKIYELDNNDMRIK